jgi:pyrroline-5-carboxylate reductase
MRINFIGGGNMASALIGGLLRQPGLSAANLAVADVSREARDGLANRYQVAVFADAADTPQADMLVLAVKPQQMKQVAFKLRAQVRDALVISIAAGIRTQDLSRWLGGHGRIVRAMPNMPAMVSAGITGLYAMPETRESERAAAEAVLQAVGSTLWVEREDLLDAVTAVSGSGPAYVFYFAEALEEAAASLGFDEQSARRLAIETFAGAMRLAAQSPEPPAVLRARVTSPGGTTERALQSLEGNQVKRAIIEAVRAAAERARELGDEYGKD